MNTSSLKNVCVVGCGKIGNLHAKNLTGKVNLNFYSRTPESAQRLNDSFSGRGVFRDYEEVLNSQSIDAVVLASPPAVHKDQIIAALQSGKSVLVEKPMCISLQELNEIGKHVPSQGSQFLMIAENYYYKPSLFKLKKWVDEYIGSIRRVVVRKEKIQNSPGWRRKHGALLEGGIHFVALISDLFEKELPKEVKAEFPGHLKETPERNSILQIVYPSGSMAELTYSWNTKSLTQGVFQHSLIKGEKGKITFESNGLYISLNSKEKKAFIPCLKDISGHQWMTQDFLKCLRGEKEKPYSDFQKAKRDLEIVFKAYAYL